MKKLVAVVCSAALMGASGVALAQTASKDAMTGSTAGKSMDFKKMDVNNDGWCRVMSTWAFTVRAMTA